MKPIYIVTESVCAEGEAPEALMAFDCEEDAEKMAKINHWIVKELLLVESNKAQINFRETLPTFKENVKHPSYLNDWVQKHKSI